MKISSSRTKDGLALSGELPEGLKNASSLEIFPLKEGAYLITVDGFLESAREEPAKMAPFAALSEKEKSVLAKMLSIRFEKRTPSEAKKLLGADEAAVLESLVRKKMVWIFHSPKYDDEGVYNISDFAFGQAREPKQATAREAPHADKPSPIGIRQPAALAEATGPLGQLERTGWIVLENESDVRGLSEKIQSGIKQGELYGIRAFDRKYYLIKKSFAERWVEKILRAISKEEKGIAQIASETGLEAGGCTALLYQLCDMGDVLEKHRGKFAKA